MPTNDSLFRRRTSENQHTWVQLNAGDA
jgi:hypothetical protein